MAETILPKSGFVSETGTAQTLLPGSGYVSETVSGGGSTTTIALAAASWVWTGRAFTKNSKTMIALARATWTWTGRAFTWKLSTIIRLAATTWRWTGRNIIIPGPVAAAKKFLMLLGVGR